MDKRTILAFWYTFHHSSPSWLEFLFNRIKAHLLASGLTTTRLYETRAKGNYVILLCKELICEVDSQDKGKCFHLTQTLLFLPHFTKLKSCVVFHLSLHVCTCAVEKADLIHLLGRKISDSRNKSHWPHTLAENQYGQRLVTSFWRRIPHS